MLSNRFAVATICALALPLAACGGGDDGGGDDGGPVEPEGTHYGYVVSKASIPPANGKADDYGLDLGARLRNTPDGTIDNALGETLGSISALADVDIQGAITEAIDQGKIALLVDFQTTDFTTAGAAGLSVRIGDTTMITPAACADAADTACRRHLGGNGTFMIAASSPTNASVAGKIARGTFNGGPGDLSLQLALGDGAPIQLNLKNARARATGISATGMTAIVGGLLPVTDLATSVFPGIQSILAGIVDEDCPQPRVGMPNCNCASSSTFQIIDLFDGKLAEDPTKDCVVSLREIADSTLIKPLIAADVCSTATCTAADALSLGIKIEVVKATFPL
ncbi:MAG: hypothetical protein H7138_14225 [Myxococcales bacterium]|nr:hypothetical protein [Myxococcales bacterium]